MRIDAHQHFWQLARADYGWLTPALTTLYRDFMPDDLQAIFNTHGVEKIDGTILVQAAPTLAETDFLLDLARQFPLIKGVIGWVDLCADDASKTLHRLAQNPAFKGVRPMVQDLPQDDWLTHAPIDVAMRTLIDCDLIFEALVKPRHLTYLLAFLTRYPQLKVTLNHAAKPTPDTDFMVWKAALVSLAQHPQIVCKLSGMVTEFPAGVTTATLQPWVDTLLEVFGPTRLMWGSDWPVLTLSQPYHHWYAMSQELLRPLSEEGRAAIFGTTASRWYGLQ